MQSNYGGRDFTKKVRYIREMYFQRCIQGRLKLLDVTQKVTQRMHELAN